MSKNSYFKKCNILGVDIDVLSMPRLVQFVTENLSDIKGSYICVANVHTTITASENSDYMNVQNSSILTIPDGGPLSSYAKKKGYLDIERTTGPDFMNAILLISSSKGYRHFFYGSTTETLEKLKGKIQREHPGVDIVGMYSPPFRKLTDDENRQVIQMINDAKPDFLWVGLGAPKQEIFMFEHKDVLNCLMVGVGAAFDYKAGNIKRAPIWMQRFNLEWLYRLIQNPGKLWKRYFITNFKFLKKVLLER